MGRIRCKGPGNPVSLAVAVAILSTIASVQLACGGAGKSFINPNPTPTPVPANQPTFSHVILVVEENHKFSDVIGNSSMPYFNSLASQYGLAKQYFADGHPSMPNYLMLTTGRIETFDDNFSGTITDDNVVHELVNAGKTWKAYEESIPSAGYLGGDAPPYVRRHNPFSYLSDVQSSPSQAANIVPFTQFATDLVNNTLPQYSFISPDVNNDAHDGTLAQADAWLQSNIAPLIASSTFQNGGLLIITFDEAEDTDLDHGGGQVATVIISPKARPNFQSETMYQHESTLRLILSASGVNKFPGQAAAAPDMTEFFAQ
ncbi:MAG TPA: alkaline phosphatase family protein [Candidatus Sulfotelmatobacter sp.]|nr:alkaline phosphatase family protein [Candidatus Sulfotelmatobacter sp.]